MNQVCPLVGRITVIFLCAVVLVAGCGGAGVDGGLEASRAVVGLALEAGGASWVTARAAAAAAVAGSPNGVCATVRPFYWEIGDKTGALASGSVDAVDNPTTYTATTVIPVASASKWLYSAYFVQRAGGVLSEEDLKFLTLRSGYSKFLACPQNSTVQSCLDFGPNGEMIPANEGLFFYSGGHMQRHAFMHGLGPLGNAELANEIRTQLGTDIHLAYSSPQPAGGVATSPEQFGKVLRKMMTGHLHLGGQLGASAVCADPVACPGEALTTAAPEGETWQYSIGHWVESDPVVGDGSFSSPGVLGFYPWIDSTKSWYGIVARVDNGADASVFCGRAIRRAWINASPLWRLIAR